MSRSNDQNYSPQPLSTQAMNVNDRERLSQELADVRAHADRLEAELKRISEAEQHDAVDHLEEHFEAIENRYRNLREFLKTVFVSNT